MEAAIEVIQRCGKKKMRESLTAEQLDRCQDRKKAINVRNGIPQRQRDEERRRRNDHSAIYV